MYNDHSKKSESRHWIVESPDYLAEVVPARWKSQWLDRWRTTGRREACLQDGWESIDWSHDEPGDI